MFPGFLNAKKKETGFCKNVFLSFIFRKKNCFFLLALFFVFKPAFSQSEVTVVTIISANYSEYKKNENTSEDEIHLSGNVKLSVEKEKSKTEIKADDVTFNRSTQMLYAKGNVRILKSAHISFCIKHLC